MLTCEPVGRDSRELADDWVTRLDGLPDYARDDLDRFGIDLGSSRARVSSLWTADDGEVSAARPADEARWSFLAALAKNKPIDAYR